MKIFAHRGASGTYPENTHSAIKAAIEIGVDGIEVDVQSTSDDYAIIHDVWLDRTTTGQGKVSNFPLSEIQLLDAGNGEYVPSLQQLLTWVNDKTIINLELKNTKNLSDFAKLLESNLAKGIISEHNLLVSSFDHHQLKWIKHYFPWLKIGALTASIPLDYAKFASQLNAYSVHVDKSFVNRDFVKDAHLRGLKIYAYTVDKFQDIEEMQHIGIDGIFTNYPANTKVALQQILKK